MGYDPGIDEIFLAIGIPGISRQIFRTIQIEEIVDYNQSTLEA